MLERVEESAPPLCDLELKRFERERKLTLPADYRAFLLKHNGGRPVPADFLLKLKDEPLHWRLHFFFGANENMFYLRRDEPGRGSVHFGATPSDGQRVRLIPICGSFTQFLERLGEIEPYG